MAAAQARIDGVTGKINTWILGDDDEVIVIDPGADSVAVLDAVGDRQILAVICTHGHPRHCAAAVEVASRDEALTALHPGDRYAWRTVHGDTAPDIDIEDGGTFEVAGVALEVLHAPGHSRGSCCLYCEDLGVVFAGDVVSQAGPVAHEGGFPNWARQLDAIGAQILTLLPETRILPGHGAELSVATAEKRFDTWAAAGPEAVADADADDADSAG